jgi:L-fuculose-phosphate aldolase
MTTTTVTHLAEREVILDVCRRMNESGLNQGTSGNASVRIDGGLLVTPSGVPYDELRPEHVVELRMDGSAAPGQLVPSTEWRFHRDILARRPEVGGVFHCHAMFATTLSCLRREIPAVHYMIAAAGGPTIRCAPYATYGTAELSAHALQALEGRKACLLANHGMITVGTTLPAAFKLAVEVETLAAQYWRALQIGQPVILDDEEIARVMEGFATYGKQPGR